MSWNPIRNSDYLKPKEQYIIKCPKYNKDATITIYYRATKISKKDIQPTRIESGWKCSLWDENNPICPVCSRMPKDTK